MEFIIQNHFRFQFKELSSLKFSYPLVIFILEYYIFSCIIVGHVVVFRNKQSLHSHPKLHRLREPISYGLTQIFWPNPTLILFVVLTHFWGA